MTFPLNISKKSRLLALALFFTITQLSQISAAETGVRWEKDLDMAKAQARSENKPLLLHFYGDSCPPCKLMERDVFPNARVVDTLNSEFVAVKIDTSRSPQLMSEYGVRMIPTDVFLAPTGEKLHERVGGAKVEQFVSEISQIAAKFQKPQQVQPTQLAQQPQPQSQPQPTGVVPGAYAQTNNQPQPAQMPATGFAGYAMSAPTAVPPSQDESEGFAVSGQSSQPQNPTVAARLQQIQVQQIQPVQSAGNSVPNPSPMNPPQGTMPQEYAQPMTAGQQQPYMNSAPAQSPMQETSMAQTIQPAPQAVVEPQMQQPMPSYAASAAPNMSVGSFENGIVRKQPTTGLGAGTSLGVIAAVSETPGAVQRPTVALDGYCPVSLAQAAQWVKGNADITTEYDGVLFRFASAEMQNAFAVNPSLYAPVLRGNDVVELLTNRREVAGQRKFGAWYHGQVFLFANAENYGKFQTNPELYAFQAQQPANTLATHRPTHRPID